MKKEKQPGTEMSMMGKKAVIGLAAVAVVVIAAFGLGNQNAENQEPSMAAETTVEVVQEELPVNEKEEILLSTLYKTMVSGSDIDTARVLNENEKDLTTLLTETLQGEKYCYWEEEQESGETIRFMEPLTDSEFTKGMVITRYNTVFYGSYKNGKPNGICHAIQAMVLDEPRYTFADGMWIDGKMEGKGSTGYRYYLNAPANGYVMTEKTGTYAQNLLNGTFVYQTESNIGEKLSWEMEADMGVTVINDDWKHYPLLKQYMLSALEDSARAYVLTEERAGALIWNNLITWNE